MAKLVLELSGVETPMVSGSKSVSIRRLINLLVKLVSGRSRPGAQTLTVRNAAVSATGTVTFAAGVTANDTVTINGTALTATKKNATGTATFSTIVADNTVTIGGVTFTAKASASGDNQFALGANDTEAAANLVTKINAHPSLLNVVTATSSSGVVTIRAVNSGTAGNAITLTKVGSPISVSGAVLSGGAAATNNAFDPGNSAATAAQAFVDAVNASTTGAVRLVVATRSNGVVTLTAQPGAAGNLFTLAESGSNTSVSGAVLTGGSESNPFTFSF